MEIISFALGIASILVMISVVAEVWIMLKVIKLIKLNQNLEKDLSQVDVRFDQRLNEFIKEYSDEVNEIYDTINKRIDDVYSTHKEAHDSIVSEIDRQNKNQMESHEQSIRYVDSRIDKLLNNPKFCLNGNEDSLELKGESRNR